MTTVTPDTRTGRDCGSGSGCHCDDPTGLQRMRYFPRQLVGPEDLTQDQRYLREKQRRHNRMLHGWGVVCGVRVHAAADEDGEPLPYTVCVDPGYVLGPCGDEILVEHTVSFDVRRATDDVSGECPPPADPWCAPVRVDRDPDRPIYLAIRYDECLTRPVQAESGCGCGGEADCEYSRIHDGYVLGILDEVPRGTCPPHTLPHRVGTAPPDVAAMALECTAEMRLFGRPCPPCPTSPWVVLSTLHVGSGGVVEVDEFENRRWTASYGSYGFCCEQFIPLDEPFDDTTRETLLGVMATNVRDEVELRKPRDVLRLAGTSIRGVANSAPLANAIGERTVEELAEVEPEQFVEEAKAAGAKEDVARQVIERARLVSRLARAGG